MTPIAKTTYTVEPGDTCFAIASSFGVSTDALANANPGLCDSLTAGDVLTIPEAAEDTNGGRRRPDIESDRPGHTDGGRAYVYSGGGQRERLCG